MPAMYMLKFGFTSVPSSVQYLSGELHSLHLLWILREIQTEKVLDWIVKGTAAQDRENQRKDEIWATACKIIDSALSFKMLSVKL
ncbi:hypothetical protein BDW75DRAFT_206881 [Aspergillus navahoensis]